MKVNFSSKGNFSKAINWLKDSSLSKPDRALRAKAEAGRQALSKATPVGDTGETANGWQYKISNNGKGAELAYYNTAHPETEVNVAKLIQLGHATRSGTYVPPNDFIRPAVNEVFGAKGEKLMKELME